MKMLLCLMVCLLGISAAHASILPKGHALITVAVNSKTGLTFAQYNAVLDKVYAEYHGDFEALGAKYDINRNWKTTEVNSVAYQTGNVWTIEMYGGLARYPGMTPDAETAVACHETGHHLGGAPKYGQVDGSPEWAADEGEADYYAVSKCMKRVWAHDDNAAAIRGAKLAPSVILACKMQADPNLCARIAVASKVLADILGDLGGTGKTDFDKPDKSVVTSTNDAHPEAQCRLDTYLHGALCSVEPHVKNDAVDPKIGACWEANDVGARPACWFNLAKP